MDKLTTEERAMVISCLVEGNSIRATVRMTGIAKNTVVKLLVEIGHACTDYQDKVMQSEMPADSVRRDLVLCRSKNKNTCADKKRQGNGDCWTWTGLCPDTSWFRAGSLATAAQPPPTTSYTTCKNASPIASSSPRTDTRRI